MDLSFHLCRFFYSSMIRARIRGSLSAAAQLQQTCSKQHVTLSVLSKKPPHSLWKHADVPVCIVYNPFAPRRAFMMFCNGHLHHPPSCPLQSTHQAEPLKILLCCFFLFFPPSSPLCLCCRMNKTLRADGLLALMVSPFYLHLMSYLNFMTDVLPLPHPENV